MRRRLFQPPVEVRFALHVRKSLHAAPEDPPLVPGLERAEQQPALQQVRRGRDRHDPSGNHERAVRPLPTDDGDELEHLLGLADRLHHRAPPERLESPHRFLVVRIGLVRHVHQVRREHKHRVPNVALHMFGHQSHVANAVRVGWRLHTVDRVQRPRRGHQVAGAANAADSRRDDQPIQRASSHENPLEPSIHRSLAPRIHHDAIGDVGMDLQVPFDAIHVQGDCRHCHLGSLLLHTRVLRPFRRSGAAAAAIPL
jgi:hypothetical protein